MGKLNEHQQFLLDWIGADEVTLYGLCRGDGLDVLVALGLADVGEIPPNDYSPVRLTADGVAMLSDIQRRDALRQRISVCAVCGGSGISHDPPRMRDLLARVAVEHDVDPDDLKRPSKKRHFSHARDQFCFEARAEGRTWSQIGAFVGLTHGSAHSAAARHERRQALTGEPG